MNYQSLEKPWHDSKGRLDTIRVWRTIQGEGPLAGKPAVFVRLAGCNLQCSFCDTDYTSSREVLTVAEVFDRITSTIRGGDIVVITGGEPLRQNCLPLVSNLFGLGLVVQIETNGTLYLNGIEEALLVCSPKTPKVNQILAPHVDAWKYVLSSENVDPKDGLPIGIARPVGPGDVYVQPMDEYDHYKNRENMLVAVNSCLTHGYRLSLQLHKIVGLD